MRKLILPLFLGMVWVVILVFVATVLNANASYLKWDASTGDVDGYIVEWIPTADLPGAADWNTKKVGNVTVVEDIDTVFGLYPGTSYTFRVLAWNPTGPSGPSNSVEYIRPEWKPPGDTVVEEIDIPIASPPGTLILNFIVKPDPG